jgi:hypothetical protein
MNPPAGDTLYPNRMGTVHGIEHHVPRTVEVLSTGAVAA